MQYLRLPSNERAALLRALAEMPDYLSEQFEGLSDAEARRPGPDGAFSPVEQVWHLAELEREGFGTRIRRLREEHQPHLPDFDGARLARERGYRARSLRAGLAAFAAARRANLDALQSVAGEEWLRAGTQEAAGGVSLCDMPAFLQQHDTAHRLEIEQWRQARLR